MFYDLAIIGGGPAAAAAAVYAARKRLNTIVIAEEVGGQSSVSDTIYNWIGTPEIKGADLATSLRAHMEQYSSSDHTLTLQIGNRAEKVTKNDDGSFTIAISTRDPITAKSVLVATGSHHRALDVSGAEHFQYKGVMYCATCDGPLFSGMPVAVIGGGNAALESVFQLSQYTSHVTLLHRRDVFRADPITVEKVKALPNVTIRTNVAVKEVKGESFVSSIVFTENGEDVDLPVNGIFVEIGQLPNTDLVKDIVALDESNKVIVDPKNQRTQTTGIWAAGDCTNGLYHQNNIAAGDAVKAIEDLYIWLKMEK